MAEKINNNTPVKATAKQSKSSTKSTGSGKQQKANKAAPKKPSPLQRFAAYMKNVRQEVKRTSWPSRIEVLRLSGIVIGALLFFGVTIFALDSIMTRFIAFYATLAPEAVAVTSNSVMDMIDQIFDSLMQ